METRDEIERIATLIVDSAFAVHRTLGPGLLESAYQVCLRHELLKRGLTVRSEVALPIVYDGIDVGVGYRVDMIVHGSVVVEHKTVQALSPVHAAQLITYLKLSGLHLGFLINWNVPRIKDGVRRFVYQL